MRIKGTWVLLSALAAVMAALTGCGGAAPASQTAEVAVGYKIGMHAPEFRMSLLDGTSVTTTRLVEQGKPAFIYFHATW